LIFLHKFSINKSKIVYREPKKKTMISLSYRVKQFILLSTDIASFYIAFIMSLTLRYQRPPTPENILQHIPLFSIVFFFWIVLNYINGLYDLVQLSYTKKYYRRLSETAILSLIGSACFFYLLPANQNITPKTILVLNVIIGYSISAALRAMYNRIIGIKRLQTNVIFVGVTKETEELIETIKQNPERGYKTVAIIDPEKHIKNATYDHCEVFHGLHTIRPCITNYQGHVVVMAPHLKQNEDALRELYQLLFWKVHIIDLPSFYESITGRIPPSTFSESWFLNHLQNKNHPVYEKIRTIIDYIAIVFIGAYFILLLPIIAITIKITSTGPIFIKQKRIGQQGKIFTMYKFRSMYALAEDGSAETDGWEFAKKQDIRITSIGTFLRKTRIDELPQVINLFKRDITLIGPRPERPAIVEELETRMPYYPLRHLVRPGLTGWAVIHQHYTDTLESSLEKLQYDLYYIKNRSLLLDISILLRTINVVMRFMGQ